MSDTPFTTIGDEPVEARIVAWVLGEASAFEAAELERLCEERPELLVFRRRMRALHGLLTEAEAARPDDGWKLPPEKRKVLDEIFGGEKEPRPDAEKENRIRRSGRRAFLAIAACLVLTAVVMGLLGPAGIRKLEYGVTPMRRSESPESEAGSANKERELESLREAVRNQEDKVEERRKVLATMARTKGIIYRGDDLFADRSAVDEDKGAKNVEGMKDETREEAIRRGLDAQDYVDAKRDFESDQQLLQAMKLKLIGEETSTSIQGDSLALNEPESRFLGAKLQKSESATPPPAPAAKPASQPETPAPEQAVARFARARIVPPAEPSLPLGDLKDSDDRLESARQTADGGIIAGRTATNDDFGTVNRPMRVPAAAATATATGEPVVRYKYDLSAGQAASKAQPAMETATRGADAKPSAESAGEEGRLAGATLEFATSESSKKGQASSGGGFGGGGATMDGKDLPMLGDRFKEKNEVASLDAAPAAEGESLLRKEPARDMSVLDGVAAVNAKEADMPEELVEKKLSEASGGVAGAVRSNPALTAEHASKVDDVRRNLHEAEGQYNLGKYDDAKRGYENTLRQDPYNSAARRGLERIESAKSDYYRAAYDHTRAELLSQVDKSWELSVPADGEAAPVSGQKSAPTPEGTTSSSGIANLTDGAKSALTLDPNAAEQNRRQNEQAAATSAFSSGTVAPAPNGPIVNHFWDTSKSKESAGTSGGVEYGARIGHANGYFFKGADLNGPATTPKFGVNREFQYPTEYDVPELPASASGPSAFPTTPAAPTSWMMQDEGSKANLSELAQREMIRRQVKNPDAESRLSDEEQQAISDSLSSKFDLSEAVKKCKELLKLNPENSEALDALRVLEESQVEVLVPQQKLEQPKPDLTEAMEEIAAAEDPYSTFSLNVSDASFQVAQAALAKGEQPDPAGIKVEQFYNAVDYGDPAPAAGEPVAVAIEQSAHPVIPGRNLVRIALKTAAAGRSSSQPLRLTLLVDQSGSMVREDRRVAMDKALAGLSGLLTKNDLVTVVGFSRTPRLLADAMPGDKAGKLAELVNQAASEGGTNLEEAIKLAEQMAVRNQLAGAQNRIVLFTDGAANLGNANPVRLAERVKVLRQKGIAFDIAGIAAEDLNDELLGELARNGNGRYHVVGKGADDDFAKQLAGAFRPAAENVKVQVRFNPERVGRYKLIGFEKDRLKTEDFRNDAVDAAELAAEEAGVAVYQIEPLADGKGELGEVSVRFRDTAADRMVERTWTIPHDSGAPAFDRATPSMQLAVLSMLAAEKLKGGPLGEAIDFNQLTGARANVKGFYGNAGRVGEILHMVDSLK